MGVQSLDGEHAAGLSDLLAVGFGTTVAMWAVGYVGHMPLTDVSPAVFVSLMLVCLVAGGWVVGRKTRRGIHGGLGLGLIVALLNLLVLGSVKSMLDEPNTGQIVPQAWLWVPGYFAVCLALASAGAAAGKASREHGAESREKSVHNPPIPLGEGQGVKAVDWLLSFAWTACLATLLLISIGGLVTGFRAGMAVPDWPNTYGSNMFFYPLAKMTGGVFYEHAHRLLGSLVGLTTLTLAVLLSIDRRSIGALVLVWIVGLCVVLQGVVGGIRVTGNSTHLAVVHGFFAHVILAGMIGVAVLLAPRPLAQLRVGESAGKATSPNETDVFLATFLVLAILGQTLLGTLVRQMDVGLMIHLSVAMLVAVLAILVGVRLWGLYPHITVFARGGVALMGVVILQLILGGISLVFRTPPAAASPSAEQLQAQANALCPAVHAILTTAHQTMAAVLLAIATLLAFWAWRLAVMQATAATTESSVANAEAATTA
ncbi:MAG: COX15/CtaA family protein [Thermoguttaceae bacterium]